MPLLERLPTLVPAELLKELVPPREFQQATFENYIPSQDYPSQESARASLIDFLKQTRRDRQPGIYLDGGFGVGKTHLLAATFHAYKTKKKLFGSFIAFTSLVGGLGFANALGLLKSQEFIAIDEFELDDPGNTMIMSRLINELSEQGVRFAVTSNTAPNALGEGRFAAADFQREILGIGRAFTVLRVDGEDYRHRDFDKVHRSFEEAALRAGSEVVGFEQLLSKLESVHPALYTKLLVGIQRVGILNAHTINTHNDALRFVAFVDRAYELQVGLRSSGIPLTDIFPAEYLVSGYAKKYLRAISRLGALVEK